MEPDDHLAPFALTAITLRGVGSYLNGARLDIKPLTVLCGTNGSGKSTWLRVLNILAESVKAGTLPYAFHLPNEQPDDIAFLNAFYYLASPEDYAETPLGGEAATTEFGPPGTVGIEFRSNRKLSTEFSIEKERREPIAESCRANSAGRFLWLGICPAGMSFRIRMAHPTNPDLAHFIELEVDGKFVFRLVSERPGPKGSGAVYELGLSAGFLPSGDRDPLELLAVASVDHASVSPSVLRSHIPGVSTDLVARLMDAFGRRIRPLLELVLSGYYYIGAVRRPETSATLDYSDDQAQRIVTSRHVGKEGEHAWLLERQFADAEVLLPESADFWPGEIHVGNCLALFDETIRRQDRRLECLWSNADPNLRREFAALTYSEPDRAAQVIAGLLSSVLSQPRLAADECWRKCQGVSGGSSNDGRRTNRLLIEHALNDRTSSERGLIKNVWPTFEAFVSYWMGQLVESRIRVRETKTDCLARRASEGKTWWRDHVCELRRLIPTGREIFSIRPVCFLQHRDTPRRMADSASRSLKLVTHPCFGVGVGTVQPPSRLSSGFHQLFPIIVQLALMQEGELAGIENPEVHLHPSLQLKATEALIANALSGRRLIVETQSDMVIRRILRAVLQEEMPQVNVAIYFTDIAQSVCTTRSGAEGAVFHYSTIEPVRIDDRGRIANWPEGFLDDDVEESQRLLDIMYGKSESEDDDD